MPQQLRAEPVFEADTGNSEGPFWIEAEQRLGWVDLDRGRLHRFDPLTGRDEAIEAGQPLGAAVCRQGGGFALAVQSGFALLDPGSTEPRMVAEIDDDGKRLRCNDGKADPRGRFWAGTMAVDMSPGHGAFYCLTPDLAVTKMLDGIGISNGLDWSLDEGTLYYIDSYAHRVDRFDYDAATGTISGRESLIPIANDTSSAVGMTVPDGMALDAEGHLWVAVFGAGEVRRYSPQGDLEAVVEVPAVAVTSCAFGGAEYGDLYITTCADVATLYRCRPGVSGRPPFAFAG